MSRSVNVNMASLLSRAATGFFSGVSPAYTIIFGLFHVLYFVCLQQLFHLIVDKPHGGQTGQALPPPIPEP